MSNEDPPRDKILAVGSFDTEMGEQIGIPQLTIQSGVYHGKPCLVLSNKNVHEEQFNATLAASLNEPIKIHGSAIIISKADSGKNEKKSRGVGVRGGGGGGGPTTRSKRKSCGLEAKFPRVDWELC